jgi:hypothetical protein
MWLPAGVITFQTFATWLEYSMSTLHEEKSLWDTGVPALKGWKAKWGS